MVDTIFSTFENLKEITRISNLNIFHITEYVKKNVWTGKKKSYLKSVKTIFLRLVLSGVVRLHPLSRQDAARHPVCGLRHHARGGCVA